jgi:hypothetical protein
MQTATESVMSVNNKGPHMLYHKIKSYVLLVIAFIVASLLAAARPESVEAGDVGVARRTGGIAEIDLVSAVAGSTVVRSLPSQEGAPGTIQIINVTAAANVVFASAPATPDGQYEVVLPNRLVAGQRIQAFNDTKDFYSASIVVSTAQPPSIKEPVSQGAVQITGYGTPGSTIQIRNAITNALLGTGTVAPAPSNGTFTIALSPPLRLFHTIRAHDTTRGLTGKNVSILNLLTTHVPLKSSCSVTQVLMGAFTRKTFACGLPRPRGVMLDSIGNPLIVAGSAPLDRGYSLLPAGLFRLAPPTGNPPTAALSLFAPVSGVALKRGEGAFPTDVFVARPRLFNVRGRVSVQPGDGEIFRVHPTTGAISVFTRALNFAPTGIAFPPPGSPFLGNLFVTDFFGAGLRRIGPTGVISTLANLPGLQGLAFGPGGNFGTLLYTAQTSRGQILRISTTGASTVFATGMISPMEIAFGPGGAFSTDLYVADTGGRQILRVNSSGGKTVFATGIDAFGLVFRATPPALFVTDYLSGHIIQFTPNS